MSFIVRDIRGSSDASSVRNMSLHVQKMTSSSWCAPSSSKFLTTLPDCFLMVTGRYIVVNEHLQLAVESAPGEEAGVTTYPLFTAATCLRRSTENDRARWHASNWLLYSYATDQMIGIHDARLCANSSKSSSFRDRSMRIARFASRSISISRPRSSAFRCFKLREGTSDARCIAADAVAKMWLD